MKETFYDRITGRKVSGIVLKYFDTSYSRIYLVLLDSGKRTLVRV